MIRFNRSYPADTEEVWSQLKSWLAAEIEPDSKAMTVDLDALQALYEQTCSACPARTDDNR
jgi:mono/diheme cytochrome c family protein